MNYLSSPQRRILLEGDENLRDVARQALSSGEVDDIIKALRAYDRIEMDTIEYRRLLGTLLTRFGDHPNAAPYWDVVTRFAEDYFHRSLVEGTLKELVPLWGESSFDVERRGTAWVILMDNNIVYVGDQIDELHDGFSTLFNIGYEYNYELIFGSEGSSLIMTIPINDDLVMRVLGLVQ